MTRCWLAASVLLAGCAQRQAPPPTADFALLCGDRLSEGKLQDADEACRLALANNPADVFALHNSAVLAHRRGARGKARDLALAAVKADVAYAPAHNLLGVLAFEDGQLAEAQARLDAALKADPNYLEARWNLGRVFLKRRAYVDAEREFRTLLAVESGLIDAQLGLAQALVGQGRLDEARAAFEACVALEPLPECQAGLASP